MLVKHVGHWRPIARRNQRSARRVRWEWLYCLLALGGPALCPARAGATVSLVQMAVPANPLWTDTGIDVSASDRLGIVASGSWTYHNGSVLPFGPAGDGVLCSALPSCSGEFLTTAQRGALIGFIGPQGLTQAAIEALPQDDGFFFVGGNYTGTADASGRLYLGFNADRNNGTLGDNVGSMQATVTATEDDCALLGGALVGAECQIASDQSKCGVFWLKETLHVLGEGNLEVGCDLEVDVTGDIVLDAGQGKKAQPRIVSPAKGSNGAGGITLFASGDIVLRGKGNASGGAAISSVETVCNATNTVPSAVGPPATITLVAGGGLVVERGASVTASTKCALRAMTLSTLGGMTIDGSLVMQGARGVRGTKTGGPLTLTAGGDVLIDDHAVVQSVSATSGANRVHVEGNDVVVHGDVASIASGDQPPGDIPGGCAGTQRADKPADARACVEVVSQQTATIDGSSPHAGVLRGEVGDSGSQGTAWVSIHALHDIAITGGAGYAVRVNGTKTVPHGGRVILKSVGGGIVASGRAMQANALGTNGSGGIVFPQAGGAGKAVDFADASVQAIGGSSGTGGTIDARSFNGSVLGSAASILDATGGTPGLIRLQGCAGATPAIAFDGTASPAPTLLDSQCGGTPSVPDYIPFGAGHIGGSINLPIPDLLVFLDEDGDEFLTPGERFIESTASTLFSFANLADGTYHVCVAAKTISSEVELVGHGACATATLTPEARDLTITLSPTTVTNSAELDCKQGATCSASIAKKQTNYLFTQSGSFTPQGTNKAYNPHTDTFAMKLIRPSDGTLLFDVLFHAGQCVGTSTNCTYKDASAKTASVNTDGQIGHLGLAHLRVLKDLTIAIDIQVYGDLSAAGGVLDTQMDLGINRYREGHNWTPTKSGWKQM